MSRGESTNLLFRGFLLVLLVASCGSPRGQGGIDRLAQEEGSGEIVRNDGGLSIVDGGTRPQADVEAQSGEVGAVEDVDEAEEVESVSFCEVVGEREEGMAEEEWLACDLVEVREFVELEDFRDIPRLEVRSGRGLDLVALGRAEDLETLYLAQTRLTDYSWISKLSRLKHLDLSGTEIDDVGFLEGVEGLEWLDISDTNVRSLSPLLKMKRLDELYLGTSPVDPKELRALRKKLPGTAIFVDLCGRSLPIAETRAACPVTEGTDLSGLDRLVKLKVLHLYGDDSARTVVDDLKRTHPKLKVVFHERSDSEAGAISEGFDESRIFEGVKQIPAFLDGSKKVVVRRKPGRSAAGYPLPGACVNPLIHAAKKRGYLVLEPEEEMDLPGYQPFPDLDGDGREEMLVYADFNVNIETMLYVMKGTCGHLVGEFAEEGTPDCALPGSAKGLSDILVTHHSVVPRVPARHQPHRFNGKTYRPNPKNAAFLPMRTRRFRIPVWE